MGRPMKITQEEFGVLLGSPLSPLDGSAVGHWETSGRVPEGPTIARILEICDVEERALKEGVIGKLGPRQQVRKVWVERGLQNKKPTEG